MRYLDSLNMQKINNADFCVQTYQFQVIVQRYDIYFAESSSPQIVIPYFIRLMAASKDTYTEICRLTYFLYMSHVWHVFQQIPHIFVQFRIYTEHRFQEKNPAVNRYVYTKAIQSTTSH